MSEPHDPSVFSYRAFVSYSRADKSFVDDLYKRLQRFRTPKLLLRTAGQHGAPPRSLNIFLDRRSAQAGGSLDDRIVGAIQSSAFLIVVCSAASRKSYWVEREIETFLQQASLDRLLPVFLRTDPAQPLEEILPAPLVALGDRLPIGADIISDDGLEPVTHKLIGALIGFSQDRVAREQERADLARRRIERAALSVITLLSLGAAVSGWAAYSEARKAEASLQAAIGSLNETTPFVRDMLSRGRLTTSDASTYASSLETVFESVEKSQISNRQLRHAWGQVMVEGARLLGEAGHAVPRQATAERAFRLLLPAIDDGDSNAVHAFCEAAMESARALAQNGFTDLALSRVRACDQVSVSELEWRQPPDEPFAILAVDAVQAKVLEAEVLTAQEQFTAALASLETASGAERLGAVAALAPSLGPSPSQELAALVQIGQGRTFEAMGRYAEAKTAFEAALALYRDAGSDGAFELSTRFAMLGVLGIHGADHVEAMDTIAQIDAALSEVLLADPTKRSAVFERARLTTLKGQVLASTPRSDWRGESSAGPLVEANIAFAESGQMMTALLAHDPENLSWRSWEAQRLSLRSDMYFRAFEDGNPAGLMCVEDCLVEATADANQALQVLDGTFGATVRNMADGVQPRRPDLRQIEVQRVELLIQLARYMRYLGQLSDAQAKLQAAQDLLSGLDDDGSGGLAGSALRMRHLDEKADLAAARGDTRRAIELYQQTLDFFDDAVSREPGWSDARRSALWSARRLAEMSLAAGQKDTASRIQQACDRARDLTGGDTALFARDREAIFSIASEQGVSCSR